MAGWKLIKACDTVATAVCGPLGIRDDEPTWALPAVTGPRSPGDCCGSHRYCHRRPTCSEQGDARGLPPVIAEA
jgi:hypothetical protein